MRRLPLPVRLDFVAPVHQAPVAGAALCALGLAAALALGISFREKLAERNRLDDALGAAAPPRHSAPSPESLKSAAEVAAVERDLDLPWTRLLAELEEASHDKASRVSVLNVEPDPGKQMVRITAEVRELPDAISFLQRLQKSTILRYPMLEGHERRKDDPEHPVRIKLAAEWHK